MNFARVSIGRLVFGVFLLLMVACVSANADTVNVEIVDFAFNPAHDTIHVGQAVKWTNMATLTPHTSTSKTGVWNSGTLVPGDSFVRTFNTAGSFPYECPIHLSMQATIVVLPTLDISDTHTSSLPNKYQLGQNYPNPFNPVTEIEYSLPASSRVTISINDILGRKVNTLIDEVKPAGQYIASWDGRDTNGNPVASGIYLYSIRTDRFTQTKKMLLLK